MTGPDVGCGDALRDEERDEDGEALSKTAWTWYGVERTLPLTKTYPGSGSGAKVASEDMEEERE